LEGTRWERKMCEEGERAKEEKSEGERQGLCWKENMVSETTDEG
jgi:hypothetical protein